MQKRNTKMNTKYKCKKGMQKKNIDATSDTLKIFLVFLDLIFT
jgi:hypothetical protein